MINDVTGVNQTQIKGARERSKKNLGFGSFFFSVLDTQSVGADGHLMAAGEVI